MIVHISFGTRDLEQAGRFYDAVTSAFGCGRVNQTETAIYYAKPGSGVGLAVTLPYDGNPATNGNGTMASIMAENREQVDRMHAAALAHGGSDEGAPGVRGHGMYAAYWRDPDGNKMNAIAQ